MARNKSPRTGHGLLTALVGLAAVMVVAFALVGIGAADLVDEDEEIEVEDVNDTVLVDVEFNSDFIDPDTDEGETSADVELLDDGTVAHSETLEVNESDFPDEYEDETVWETAEFDDIDETGNYTVSVEPESADYVDSASVDIDEASSGGIIAGASRTNLLLAGGVLVALLVAYNREII